MLHKLLTELKLNDACTRLKRIGQDATLTENMLLSLLETEVEQRQERAKIRRMKRARFPMPKEFKDLDPTLNPNIDFKKIENLFNANFLEKRQNICLMGSQGTGKTHSLIALGHELCRRGKTVRFFTACELVNMLEEAKQELRLTSIMNSLKTPHLLIIDELGFVPFSENGARLLFDVFASRYERGSIAVSTNLTFEKWTQVFGSIELTAALIDRFTHRAEIISFFDASSVRHQQAIAQRAKA